MSSTRQPTGAVQNTTFARAHPDLIMALPEPGEAYFWSELEADTPQLVHEDRRYLQMLQNHNAVVKQRVVYRHGTRYVEWQTNPDLYEYAKGVVDSRDATLPCGHAGGFVTVDADAGVYECGVEWCNERYDRETVSEVFG